MGLVSIVFKGMVDPSHTLSKYNICGFPHKKEYRQSFNRFILDYYHPIWKGAAKCVGVSIAIIGCSIRNLFFNNDIINSKKEDSKELHTLFVCYLLDYINSIRKDHNIIVVDEYGIEELCSILKPTSIFNIEIDEDVKKHFKQDDSCKYYYSNSQSSIDAIIWIKKDLKLFAKNTEMYLYYGKKGLYWNFAEIELYNSLYRPLLQNPSNKAINLIEICRNIDFYCEEEARDEVDSIFRDIYYWHSPDDISHSLYPRQDGFGFARMWLASDIREKIELSVSITKERDRIEKERKERLDNEYRLREQEKKRKEEELKRDYNSKNVHGRDSKITCKDSHYYLHDQKLLGITRIIYNFFPKFDSEYWAEIKAPLMGKTPQQLLEEWDRKGKESSEAGSILHQRIDDYYHHKEVQTEDKDYTLFKLFADAYKLNPYRNEWAIYDEDSGIVGVVDMLDYSNGEYILYDWKRSEKVVEGGQPITKNKFDEYGLKPIENVPNTDYWHYALQLSFYRYILEKNYGIKVKESRLVVLHPTLNLPVVLTTPYMIDEVNKIIAVMKM
jgi:hypothetical protein